MHLISLTLCLVALVATVDTCTASLFVTTQYDPTDYNYLPSANGANRELVIIHGFYCDADGDDYDKIATAMYVRYENATFGVNTLMRIPINTNSYNSNWRCDVPFTRGQNGYITSASCSGVDFNNPYTFSLPPIGIHYTVTYGCEWRTSTPSDNLVFNATTVFTNTFPFWQTTGPYRGDKPGFMLTGDYISYINMRDNAVPQGLSLSFTIETTNSEVPNLYYGGYTFILLMDSPGKPPIRARFNYNYNIEEPQPDALVVFPYAYIAGNRYLFDSNRDGSVFPGSTYRIRIWMFSDYIGSGVKGVYDAYHYIEPSVNGPEYIPQVLSPTSDGVAVVTDGIMQMDMRWQDIYLSEYTLRVIFERVATPHVAGNVTIHLPRRFERNRAVINVPLSSELFEDGMYDGREYHGTHTGHADVTPGVYNISFQYYCPEVNGWSEYRVVTNVTIPAVNFPLRVIAPYSVAPLPDGNARPPRYARTGMVNGFFIVVEVPRVYVYNLAESIDTTVTELNGGSAYYTMPDGNYIVTNAGNPPMDICITDDGIWVYVETYNTVLLYPISSEGVVTEITNTAQVGQIASILTQPGGSAPSENVWKLQGTTDFLCRTITGRMRCMRLENGVLVPDSGADIPLVLPEMDPMASVIVSSHHDATPHKLWTLNTANSASTTFLCLVDIAAKSSTCRVLYLDYADIRPTVVETPLGIRVLMHAEPSVIEYFEIPVPCDTCFYNLDLLFTVESMQESGFGFATAHFTKVDYTSAFLMGSTNAMAVYEYGFSLYALDPVRYEHMYLLSTEYNHVRRIYDRGHQFKYELERFDTNPEYNPQVTVSVWYDPVSNYLVEVGVEHRAIPTDHRFRFSIVDPVIPAVTIPDTMDEPAEFEAGALPLEYVIGTTPVSGSIRVMLTDHATNDTYSFTVRDTLSIAVNLHDLIAEYHPSVQRATAPSHSMHTLADEVDPDSIPDGNYTVAVVYIDLETNTEVVAIMYSNVHLFTSTTDSPDCSNHGFKVLASCTCYETHYGPICNQSLAECSTQYCAESYECTPTVVGNFSCIVECPTCGDNGFCNELHTCTCYEGWNGTLCTTSTCSFDCGIHGECGGDDCDCDEGWEGDMCEIPICPNCNGNGNCVEGSGVCTCDEGWSGSFCDMECPDCGVNSVCTDGECVCTNSWTGTLCTIAPCPSCGAHGSCVGVACVCTGGWTGTQCQLAPCQLHSSRVNGTCTCDSGYFGSDCSCTASCGSHGTCTNTTCICGSGYYGPTCAMSQSSCDSIVCHEDDMICSTSTVDNTTIVCVDPPVLPCHCHHDGVCANETDADSCTCATGTFGPYCNMTAAACATAHCGLPLVAHSCAETVNGTIACIAPVIEADGFNEENYYFIGAGVGAAIAIGVVAFVISYVNSRVRGNEFDRLRETGGAEGF